MTTPTPREALAELDRAWILAQNFHRLYEMLAPSFGYETRADTKAFVADSPNGKLMRAVCTQLIAKGHLSAALAVPPGSLAVQPVRASKIGGSYQAEGTVVSQFKTLAGEQRYVFEFDTPKGMLHIFGPGQLTIKEDKHHD